MQTTTIPNQPSTWQHPINQWTFDVQHPNLYSAAYVAGILDAQGCISISQRRSPKGVSQYKLEISLAQPRPDGLMGWLKGRFGGTIKIAHRPGTLTWSIQSASQASTFLAWIQPFMYVKAAEVFLAQEFLIHPLSRPTGHGVRPTKEQTQYRLWIATEMQHCKANRQTPIQYWREPNPAIAAAPNSGRLFRVGTQECIASPYWPPHPTDFPIPGELVLDVSDITDFRAITEIFEDFRDVHAVEVGEMSREALLAKWGMDDENDDASDLDTSMTVKGNITDVTPPRSNPTPATIQVLVRASRRESPIKRAMNWIRRKVRS